MLNALKSIRTSPLPFSEAGRNVPDEVAVIAPLHVGSVFVPELQYAMPVMFGHQTSAEHSELDEVEMLIT